MRPIGPADKAATNKLRRCGGEGCYRCEMPKTSLLFRAFIRWLLRRQLYRYTYFVLLGNKTAETDREPFTTKDLLPRVRGRRRQLALLFLFSSSSSSFHFFLKRPFPETTALYRTAYGGEKGKKNEEAGESVSCSLRGGREQSQKKLFRPPPLHGTTGILYYSAFGGTTLLF